MGAVKAQAASQCLRSVGTFSLVRQRLRPGTQRANATGVPGTAKGAKRSGIVPNRASTDLTLCAAEQRSIGASAGGKTWERANVAVPKVSSRHPTVSRRFGTMPGNWARTNPISGCNLVSMIEDLGFHTTLPARRADSTSSGAGKPKSVRSRTRAAAAAARIMA